MDKQKHRSYLDKDEALALIDKFIGSDLREEVHRMFIRDEAVVAKLLFMLRDFHDRNVLLTERMQQAEKEYFQTLAPKVSSGFLSAETSLNINYSAKNYHVRWDPGSYSMNHMMSHLLQEDKNPVILEMIEKQFQRQLEADLIPQLRVAFRKMITASHL
ncbi:hypothetical protein [Ochrobactrum sp. BTU1]|uniref:hypothetical protein n=1 Tax=Ochrobactrum sp. BTU1 TaxID=2840456 RepID=UPI001C04E7F3|nr:hypothetical protein KMS41_05030 [Ochrobactrum sp. BTU1]